MRSKKIQLVEKILALKDIGKKDLEILFGYDQKEAYSSEPSVHVWAPLALSFVALIVSLAVAFTK